MSTTDKDQDLEQGNPTLELDVGPEIDEETGQDQLRQIQNPSEQHEHHFTHEEFGETKLHYLDPIPTDRRSFICTHRRPRQFFIGDVLYREKAQRKVSWDELFLDLLYVAVIGKLASVLLGGHGSGPVQEITIWNVVDLFLVAVPVFSSWTLIVAYMNRFGRNDLLDKLGLYFVMVLVFGLGLNAEYVFSYDYKHNTSNVFIVTFLILRTLVSLAYVSHAYFNPEFGKFLMVTNLVNTQIANIPWFISLFIQSIVAKRVLFFVAYVLDVGTFVALILFASQLKQVFTYRVAMNIEHWVERNGLFVIVVLGEVIVSILPSSETPGFSYQYLDGVLGLITAISLQWLYFYLLDGYSGKFTHPLRYKTTNGLTWSLLHFPLAMSLIAGGAGTGLLVNYHSTSDLDKYAYYTVRWLVGGGYAVAVFIMVIMGVTYHTRDEVDHKDGHAELGLGNNGHSSNSYEMKDSGQGSSKKSEVKSADDQQNVPACLMKYRQTYQGPLVPRFPKYVRLLIRTLMGISFLVLTGSCSDTVDVSGFLGGIAVLSVVGVFAEEFGKLQVPKT